MNKEDINEFFQYLGIDKAYNRYGFPISNDFQFEFPTKEGDKLKVKFWNTMNSTLYGNVDKDILLWENEYDLDTPKNMYNKVLKDYQAWFESKFYVKQGQVHPYPPGFGPKDLDTLMC